MGKNIFSLLIVIFAGVYLILSLQFPFMKDSRPGAGFLPILISVGLLVLSLIDLVKSYKENKDSKLDRTYLKDFIMIASAIAIYIILLSVLGALIGTIIFTFIVLTLINKRKNLQNILISLIGSAVIYVFFEYLLGTNLPLGLFERFI
ncbi:tripartite tricarboxylate transporter TctB family protein [Bacillus sp. HNG]|uniref:tripartite tricarboxylate transporter TctB family protein n=1 Tax=Bacillus sp. HNG TaxID=2293325 RepID=UPI001678B8D5|nr:tripartite tricarboxylate transporter TctB family protein [Bacillus sp. HNG]